MIIRNFSLRAKAGLFVLLCLVFALASVHLHAADNEVTATNQAGVKPDNSRVNQRDRNNANLTADDQKENKSDRELTQKVRRAVVNKTNELSTAAKNIKIVTVNGKVTLRGPVSTQAEKDKIAALAKAAAGDGNVDDQVEVKNSP